LSSDEGNFLMSLFYQEIGGLLRCIKIIDMYTWEIRETVGDRLTTDNNGLCAACSPCEDILAKRENTCQQDKPVRLA